MLDPFRDQVRHDRGCQASCHGKAGGESKAGRGETGRHDQGASYQHSSSEADGADGESLGEIGNTCRTRGLVLPDEGLLQRHRYIPGRLYG